MDNVSNRAKLFFPSGFAFLGLSNKLFLFFLQLFLLLQQFACIFLGLVLFANLLLNRVDFFVLLVALELDCREPTLLPKLADKGECACLYGSLLLTHSLYKAITSSTISTEAPRLRCDSRTISGLPPRSSMNKLMSSIVLYLTTSSKNEKF